MNPLLCRVPVAPFAGPRALTPALTLLPPLRAVHPHLRVQRRRR